MRKGNITISPRLLQLKKKRRKILLFKSFLFLLGFSAILAGLVYISRISIFNISSIEVASNKIADTESIKKIIEKDISGYYLWFFPKTNVFLYPKDKIKEDLSLQFKKIKDVDLSVRRKVLEVSFTERAASYTWCGKVYSEAVDNKKCYLMDEGGFIFDEAADFSGGVYFKFYGSTDKSNPLGSYFLEENFEKLLIFKKTLEGIGLVPFSLYLLESGDVKIFLSKVKGKMVAPVNPYVIFRPDADLELLAGNLETALNTQPLLSDFKNKYSSLKYIDLRYGNKVYYKFEQ